MVVSGKAKVKVAYCKVCKIMTRWVFLGHQGDIFLKAGKTQIVAKKTVVAYYNCEKCHDTRAFPVEDEDECN